MLTIAAQMFIAAWKQNAAEDLLAKKTTIVGTLRRNKTEVPSELTEAMGREVGSSLFCFDRQLTLVSYILKRKKCVLLLSTMHHDDAVNEDQERKADIVLFYNETKSGVDTLDQPVLVYTCKRRTRRWPMDDYRTEFNIKMCRITYYTQVYNLFHEFYKTKSTRRKN
ncbi:hypothetical protein T09_14514 [Trichinella sp. T9]|nr:hypothetical protein T09_14514 [Trichinella sp. T9]